MLIIIYYMLLLYKHAALNCAMVNNSCEMRLFCMAASCKIDTADQVACIAAMYTNAARAYHNNVEDVLELKMCLATTRDISVSATRHKLTLLHE